VCSISLLLIYLLEMLRVVFADDIIAEIRRHDPSGLLAVHSSVQLSILILS
jgi:hypothetical protein